MSQHCVPGCPLLAHSTFLSTALLSCPPQLRVLCLVPALCSCPLLPAVHRLCVCHHLCEQHSYVLFASSCLAPRTGAVAAGLPALTCSSSSVRSFRML